LTGPAWVAMLVPRAVYKPFTPRLATFDWRRIFIFCIRIHVVVGNTGGMTKRVLMGLYYNSGIVGLYLE
jgi:hypothetical protein